MPVTELRLKFEF